MVNMENMYFIFVWSPTPRPQVLVGPWTKATDQNQGHLQRWLSPLVTLPKVPLILPGSWPHIRQKCPLSTCTLLQVSTNLPGACLEAIKIGQEKRLLCLVCQEVGPPAFAVPSLSLLLTLNINLLPSELLCVWNSFSNPGSTAMTTYFLVSTFQNTKEEPK